MHLALVDPEPHALVPQLPALDPTRTALPDPVDLAYWRQEADVRVEGALADFDDALLRGDPADQAAQVALDTIRRWVTGSIGRFATPQGAELVRGDMRQQVGAAWQTRERHVVQVAGRQPSALDQHLRIYVGTSYEVAARGYASLVSLRC
jgi:hypothetical protein